MNYKKPISPGEILCIRGYLQEQTQQNLDLAYLLSRNTPSNSIDEKNIHKMALRWLASEDVQNYLKENFYVERRLRNNFPIYEIEDPREVYINEKGEAFLETPEEHKERQNRTPRK